MFFHIVKLLQGTTYVYDAFFKPVILKHETEIDRNLLELRTRAGDMLVLYWQKVASYGQTRIYDILQYIASQSNPPPPTQVLLRCVLQFICKRNHFQHLTRFLLNASVRLLASEDLIHIRVIACLSIRNLCCISSLEFPSPTFYDA